MDYENFKNGHFEEYDILQQWLKRESITGKIISLCQSVYEVEKEEFRLKDLEEGYPEYAKMGSVNDDFPDFDALKEDMDAMRHQGTCRHDVDKLSPVERKTATIVGEGSGLTGRSVQRYIRLTELLPELLEMVDNKQLSLVNGVDIAAFDKEVQSYLLTYIKEKGSIAPAQLAALKKQPNLENLTPYTVMTIMKEAVANKPKSKKISFTEKKLNQFFPGSSGVIVGEKHPQPQ